MCLICVEFKKEALTVTEAWRNLQEMKEGMPDEHYDEVVSLIVEQIYEDQGDLSDEDDLDSLMETLEDAGQLSFGGWEMAELNLSNDEEVDTREEERDLWDSDYLGYFED
jgi:hypothetical protein